MNIPLLQRRFAVAPVILALAVVATLVVGCEPTQPPAASAGQTPGASATSTAASTTSATASPTASSAPTAAYSFPLLPPGSPLPSEAFCAAHVQRTSWEPRPDNQAANSRVPTASQIAGLSAWDESIGVDPKADQLRRQITGNFTGTTDEILQWVACKWGVPVDVVRAEAVIESYWHQNQQGDWSTTQSECPPGMWNGSGCYQSYGILQIKYQFWKSAWPMSRDDTAFSAEYMYGAIRTCYEGWTTYLNQTSPEPGYAAYHAGDLWGCLGRWYSGAWYNQGAIDYIAKVKLAYEQKTWRDPSF